MYVFTISVVSFTPHSYDQILTLWDPNVRLFLYCIIWFWFFFLITGLMCSNWGSERELFAMLQFHCVVEIYWGTHR